MWARPFGSGLALAALLLGTVGAAVSAKAQSDAELKALNQRVIALHNAGRYARGLALQRRLTAAVEKAETAKVGKPGPETAAALGSVAWYALFARQFTEALAASERAHALAPDLLWPQTNRGHALLFLGRVGEARALYFRHKGKYQADKLWEDVIEEDFRALRKAGVDHIAFDRVIKALGLDRSAPKARIDALDREMRQLHQDGRYADAVPVAGEYLSLARQRYGEDRQPVIVAMSWLAESYLRVARYTEAEPLLRRALAIDEASLGPEHPNVAARLNHLALLLQAINRVAEAEPLLRRALAIHEKSLGPDHPEFATALNNLAFLLKVTNALAEAEPLIRRALAISEKSLGPDHPNVAKSLSNLAQLLHATNRIAEAEPLFRRALAIEEKSVGPDHPSVATQLNWLAGLLQYTNRFAEAELLVRRALAINEKSLGPDHPKVAIDLNDLAVLLQHTDQFAEAEPLLRRALAIEEKSLGPDHPSVASSLNNLAELLHSTNRLTEAEPLYRRALALNEKSFGPDHPRVATVLNNLAVLLGNTNRLTEAEPLYRRALAVVEKGLGPDHPSVASHLNNLAALRAELGDWTEAARLHRRAVPIMTGVHGQDAWSMRAVTRAVYRVGAGSTAAREEAFELAQWALQTGAADALAQMSVRFAKGAGTLATLVRERQNLVAQRQAEDKQLLAAIGKADVKATDSIRARIAGIDAQLAAIDTRLTTTFPEYAELSNPQPLTIVGVQGLLKENEALVVFLDVPHRGSVPEETLAWAVTKTEARWISIPFGTAALSERVAQLRCGLDLEGQWAWSVERGRWEAKGEHCRTLKPDGLAGDEPLPFDLGTAHELYLQLLAPFAGLTQDKRLIVVPSGPLTSLPFHVLVTEPAKGLHRAGLTPAWLALKQPVTVLPSVGSLQALRKLPPAQAQQPFIGFGNPLLHGGSPDGELARLARARQTCPRQVESPHQRVASEGSRAAPALGTRHVNLALLRAQAPLPETADELCAVAASLGALASPDRATDPVWLGARATETNLKALSRTGRLARYRVVHFATHGVLAGESEAILKAKAEPALMLNPPDDGATPEALEEDDGLLTASEVAQLELDADWVVLSACNTAAGEQGDAEALSGLARAFFYAKARALLVSHWYVNSEAAVKLITGAFAELSAHPRIGRAEALRRSMARLITAGRPDEAHPEYWAPFVLVGEDGS